MANNSIISYENFKAIHGESWDAVVADGFGLEGDQTIFICGLSFKVGMYVNAGGFWSKLTARWTVSYYNGSSWVTVLNEDKSLTGDQEGYWTYFYHNRSAEGTSSQDSPRYHLWKITLTCVTGIGAYKYGLYTWVGGIAMMTKAEYENVCKGTSPKLIKGYRPGYWRQGDTYGSADAFLAGESPQTKRGTPISTTTGTYKWLGAGDY